MGTWPGNPPGQKPEAEPNWRSMYYDLKETHNQLNRNFLITTTLHNKMIADYKELKKKYDELLLEKNYYE